MPLVTVKGIYKDGKVELSERPAEIAETARVLVTFLPANGWEGEAAAEQNLDRETLRQRAFERMKKGIHLGGPPYPKREELYDRCDK
jgi:hypothetical protein